MQWLNVIGLVLVTAAAGLMCVLPPRITRYTPAGEQEMVWVNDANPERGKRLGAWQARFSMLGPVLLVAGFLLQLVAAVIPLVCPGR